MIGRLASAMPEFDVLVDLFVVVGMGFCFWTYFRFGRHISNRYPKSGSLLLLFGLIIFALFYSTELFLAHLLPLFTPRADAAEMARILDFDHAWFLELLGIACMIAGFIRLNANTFGILNHLDQSEKRLRQELSARQREQEALNRSEAALANAQRIAHMGSWDWNLVTNDLLWSDEIYRIFGLEPGRFDASYEAFLDLVHPGDRKLVEESITRAIRERKPFSADHRIVLANGEEKVVHEQGEVVLENDAPVRMFGTVHDITERWTAEQALREAEQRFRDFAEAASDWFWELGPDLRFTWISDRLLEASGLPREYYVGRTSRELEPPTSDRAEWEHYLARLDRHEPVRAYYLRRFAPDGRERHVRISVKPIFAPDGTFQGYRGTGREFTSETAAEEKVERVRDQFLNAIESISEGIALFDADERLVICNSKFRALTLASSISNPVGVKFEDLVRANLRAGLVNVPAEMADEWRAWRVERFRNPGDPFELVMGDRHLLIHEQRLPEGGTIYVNSDITEIKQREEALRQAQKMEVVGQLTGGVAHDFNNVLAVISGNLELLEEQLADRDDHRLFVRKCLDAAYRGATLTQRLLAFSRKQPLAPRNVDLALLLGELKSLLHRTLGENITIETALPEDLWTVRADPVQLENAILNLAVNGRDAMVSGGRLTIEAENRVIGEENAPPPARLEPGEYVVIAVSDTGAGMAPDVAGKAFEPFFTTKPTGKGSGLGLSMVYGFCRQSGGDVAIYSTTGHGTSVEMFLPRSAGRTADAPVRETEAAVAGRGESILVVEDDPAVRELATDLLSSLNYDVLSADDGPAALEMLDTEKRVDLLFTDVVLPRAMDGVELARRARSRRPDLRVLYTSGYTENAFRADRPDADGARLLNKPYHKAALARYVREALDQPAPL